MKIDLTINEVNTILQALGNAPYAQVFELVEKIRTQAQAQVQTTEQQNG
jgi:hypothetical protein